MQKYAVWKDGKVIGHISLTAHQAKELNSIPGVGIGVVAVEERQMILYQT